MNDLDEIPLPSLEEIAAMEQQRQSAIESLQITDNYVQCQKCNVAVPVLAKSKSYKPTTKCDRITQRQRQRQRKPELRIIS